MTSSLHRRSPFILALLGAVLSLSALGQQRARYEPANGCYIGAFIVNDANVKDNVDSFEVRTKKQHSIYFSYANFSQGFPTAWVNRYASAGAIVQIAFEPDSGLEKVIDGPYLRTWARAAHASGAMILLRFASEMNGSWVPWYGNPALYIEKFRLVHDIMQQEAPNVAMVWCPNDVPHDPAVPANYMHSYYPGDDYVDWVGIDFYCVYYYENGTPERVDPRNKLRKVYDVYSSRKPIIVCEWAAAHYTTRVAPPESCITYAKDMMTLLYGNAATEFPRLKALCWFDWNSVAINKSNFSLTDNPEVLEHYSQTISSPHFLSQPVRNVPSVHVITPADGTVLKSSDSIRIQIEADVSIDSCVFFINSTLVESRKAPPFSSLIPLETLQDGIQSLRVIAYASSGYSNESRTSFIVDRTQSYSTQIIDNTDAGFSMTGTWTASTSQPDRYGANYAYAFAGNGSAKATWTPTIGRGGSYAVSAMWSAHTNRATNAPFTIHHAQGSTTVRVNQEVGGGVWNDLGTYAFQPAAGHRIELTNDANEIVIADAVRVTWSFTSSVPENARTPTQIILEDVFPNPFNPAAVITFHLPARQMVRLRVMDVLGRTIETIQEGEVAAGTHRRNWDGTQAASGMYFVVLESADKTIVKKAVLVR